MKVSRDVTFDEKSSRDWTDRDMEHYVFYPIDTDRKEVEEEPIEPGTPSSPVSPIQSSPSSSLVDSPVKTGPQGKRSLEEIYDDLNQNQGMFCLFADTEPIDFEEASRSEKWRKAMNEEIGNCVKIFDDLKKEMAKEFEMTDIGLMSYYLGIEVKQRDDGIFISQEAYAKEVLKRFNMKNCNPISISIEVEKKLSRQVKEGPIDQTLFRSLVGKTLPAKSMVLGDNIRSLPDLRYRCVQKLGWTHVGGVTRLKDLPSKWGSMLPSDKLKTPMSLPPPPGDER
ncbi:hypothetical protein RJ639_041421 [Escallonia herrerae]|uniref:Reverse transcriptase Ty1/copia-type domain-containing protein n=1 Tax=Escallonia herrerae TaxID=1293975 RepID=A0AA88WGP7_9ASTE|nr:hypothetical protein RJ639_041421 [Escallonia herrerae]